MATRLLRDYGLIIMITYITSGIVTLYEGRLKLVPEQYLPRLHNLKELKNDVFEIVNPVCFKAGEVIGFEGSVNRKLEMLLEPEDKQEDNPVESEKPAKAKAKAE